MAGLDALLYLATRRWALTGAIYALMALAFVVVSSGISLSRIEKRAVAAARAGPGHASGPFPRGTDGSNPVPSSKESATNLDVGDLAAPVPGRYTCAHARETRPYVLAVGLLEIYG